MKNIVVLGSTGTIGIQALEIIKSYPEKFKLLAISANTNKALLEKQISEFKPKYASIFDKKAYSELKIKFPKTKMLYGENAITELAKLKAADMICVSIVGVAALKPTYEAILAGKDIAIASKEVLVAAGHIIMPLVKKQKVKLFPIDSEHVAIDICLKGYKKSVKNICLTASGGPFLHKDNLKDVTVEMALKHPNWTMGRKITIDSATMVNKGLEVMEAHWLFDIPYEKIKVIIHPQSLVHGMIELRNGAQLAQMSTADMKMPILYALSSGKIFKYKDKTLELGGKTMEFFEPDLKKFEGLKLAYEVGKKGASWPAVFNAANEEAVELFLNKKIKYLDIISCIKYALAKHKEIPSPSIEDIVKITESTRIEVRRFANT